MDKEKIHSNQFRKATLKVRKEHKKRVSDTIEKISSIIGLGKNRSFQAHEEISSYRGEDHDSIIYSVEQYLGGATSDIYHSYLTNFESSNEKINNLKFYINDYLKMIIEENEDNSLNDEIFKYILVILDEISATVQEGGKYIN